MSFRKLQWLITLTAIWIQLTYSQQDKKVIPDEFQRKDNKENLVKIFEEKLEESPIKENNEQQSKNNVQKTEKINQESIQPEENEHSDINTQNKEKIQVDENTENNIVNIEVLDPSFEINKNIKEQNENELKSNKNELKDSEEIKSTEDLENVEKEQEKYEPVEETANEENNLNLDSKINEDNKIETEDQNVIETKDQLEAEDKIKTKLVEAEIKEEVKLTNSSEQIPPTLEPENLEKSEVVEPNHQQQTNEELKQELKDINENKNTEHQEKEKVDEKVEIKVDEKQETEKTETPSKRDEGVALEVDSIQSFEEWKKKQIISREVAAATENVVMPQRTIRAKKTQVNYASQDCGAKILTHNSEAKHVAAVLDENKDMYMLNPCSADIHFVIELCEPIQIRQLQLANFELFSSSPRIFNILISERFPAREWRLVGTFEARNERTLQTFVPNREELMFAKYVKFEMKSHFGNEHFCPLTLVRLLGLSMVEEYEENEDKQDEEKIGNKMNDAEQTESTDIEETDEEGSMSKVYNIVKTAVDNLLGNNEENKDNNSTSTNEPDVSSTEEEIIDPNWESPVTLVTNKSEVESLQSRSPIITLIETGVVNTPPHPPLYPLVFLDQFIKTDFNIQLCWLLEFVYRVSIIHCMVHSNQTSTYGAFPATNFNKNTTLLLSNLSEQPEKVKESDSDIVEPNFVIVGEKMAEKMEENNAENEKFLTEKNVENEDVDSIKNENIQNDEIKVKMQENGDIEIKNDEKAVKTNLEDSDNEKSKKEEKLKEEKNNLFENFETPKKCDIPADKNTKDKQIETENIKINDNKIEDKVVDKKDLKDIVKVDEKTEQDPEKSENSDKKVVSVQEPNKEVEIKEEIVDQEPIKVNDEEIADKPVEEVATAIPPLKVDENNYVDQILTHNEDQVVINPGTNQKESVLMRLSNRIRALEQNMALSSDYLEDLSQRYKKQMDETQRAFNCTQTKLFESSKLTQENDLKQSEAIAQAQSDREKLKQVLHNTQESMDQLNKEMIARHLFLMAVESIVLIAICVTCFGVRQIRLVKRIEKTELQMQELLEMHQKSSHTKQKQLTTKIKQNIETLQNVKSHDTNPPKILKRSRSKLSILDLQKPTPHNPPSPTIIRRRGLTKPYPMHNRKVGNHYIGKIRKNSLKVSFTTPIHQQQQNLPLGKWNSDEKLLTKTNKPKKINIKNEKKLIPIENPVNYTNGFNDIGAFNENDFGNVLTSCGNNFNDTPWQNPIILSGKAR